MGSSTAETMPRPDIHSTPNTRKPAPKRAAFILDSGLPVSGDSDGSFFRRGDVGVVSGKALRLAGDCFTHETLSFESCLSSELMLCCVRFRTLAVYVVVGRPRPIC